jgi:hypothetical protein
MGWLVGPELINQGRIGEAGMRWRLTADKLTGDILSRIATVNKINIDTLVAWISKVRMKCFVAEGEPDVIAACPDRSAPSWRVRSS